MKKSRIIFIFAVVLLLTCLLTACNGRSAKFSEVFDDHEYIDKSPAYTKMDRVIVGGNFIYSSTDFAVFDLGTGTINIYSLSQNKVVLSLTLNAGESYDGFASSKINDRYAFAVYVNIEDGKIRSTLYDDAGNLIDINVGFKKNDLNFSTRTQLLYFGETCFLVDEDGNIGNKLENSELANVPEFHASSEDYLYQHIDNSIYVYDKQLSLLSSYTVPSYAEAIASLFYILENGNIFTQYIVKEPDDSQDYNLLLDDQKHTLVTKLINPKTGKATNLNLNYVVLNMTHDFDELGVSSKIKNLMIACPIENKRVSMSVDHYQIVSLSNSGKVQFVLNDTYPAQGTNMPYLVADNRYIASTETGAIYILNQKGDVISRVDNAIEFTNSFFVTEDRIYNYDCKPVGDTINIDDILRSYDNCLLVEELDSAFIINSMCEVDHLYVPLDAINTSSDYYFYATYDDFDTTNPVKYNFFNENGKLFASFSPEYDSFEHLCETPDGDVSLISIYNTETGYSEFYRFSA